MRIRLRHVFLWLLVACITMASQCNNMKQEVIRISGVTITPDQSIAERFTRHTVTGITTTLPQPPDTPGFIGASYISVADMDGNGVKEIVCTSGIGLDGNALTAGDGAIALFTWDGSDINSWTQSVIYPPAETGILAFPNETILRDMDADGDLDIMVMDNFIMGFVTGAPSGIYYLENLGGNITAPSNWAARTIYQGNPSTDVGKSSYHRAHFMDVDGDGLEDFITAKVNIFLWMFSDEQYWWVEWFKKEGDPETDPTSYVGPYEIGEGGGFLFDVVDMDGDGDLDVFAPQFFIMEPESLMVKGPGNIKGDSLAWFENPGSGGGVFGIWNRYTIDNWYSSENPMGRGMEAIASDIDDDGAIELIYSNHNHQDYDADGNRIWPSGVYVLEIPEDPRITEGWHPVTIDSGDPSLDPDDAEAVAVDVYAVNRSGGPESQGSPGIVKAADVSGDGYPDLVVPGDGKGALYYYESEGVTGSTLAFKRAALYEDPACMPGEADIVDIDGDGLLDVVAAIFDTSVNKDTSSSSVFVFRQKAR